MMRLRISQRWFDDILVLLMFCISGNPAFVSLQPLGKIVHLLMLLILLIAFGFKFKVSILKTSIYWMIFLSIIFVAQFFLLGHITVLGSLNYITKLLCAILLASYLGPRLPKSAIRVMSVICLISLVFYCINLTGVRFKSPLDIKEKTESLIIYTQSWEDPFEKGPFRNSGLFWEPGAFAGYIVATLLLFTERIEVLWKKFWKSFILLTIALLTTFSTTGYITFFLLILLFLLKWGIRNKKRILSYSLVVLIACLGVFAYCRLDFLGEKVQHQYRNAERMTENDVSDSRFGSILFDLPYILSHPVFGNGLALSTRLRFHLGVFDVEDLDGFGNGFTGCIASMGALFMIAFLMAIGFNRSLNSGWLVIVMIVLLLQGEYFLNYPFFMMFPFICYGSESKKKQKAGGCFKLKWHRKTPIELPS